MTSHKFAKKMPHKIWTIGHSTHPIEKFIAMLQSHGIATLADVRRFPASRRHPQYNAAQLQRELAAYGMEYQPFPELGGRRPARVDSHNTAWRNDSFRGYADYMETSEFQQTADRLMKTAAGRPTAIMCAESLWWRCHRGLIADYLKIRGIEVLHILDESKAEPHPYTSAATVEDGSLSYHEQSD